MKDLTLTETLAQYGYTHKKGPHQTQHIMDSSGEIVFTGSAQKTWKWIKSNVKK